MVAGVSSSLNGPLSVSLMRITMGMPSELARNVVRGTSTVNTHGTTGQLGSTNGSVSEKKT